MRNTIKTKMNNIAKKPFFLITQKNIFKVNLTVLFLVPLLITTNVISLNDSNENQAELFFDKALSFVEKGLFDNSRENIMKSLEIDYTNMKYRSAAILNQKLSKNRYLLNKINLQLSQDFSVDNSALIDVYNTISQIISDLEQSLSNQNEALSPFYEARKLLIKEAQASHKKCEKTGDKLLSLRDADIAFKNKDFKKELLHLNEAYALGWDQKEKLNQAEIFVQAVNLYNNKKLDLAKKLFLTIDHSDKHYSTSLDFIMNLDLQMCQNNNARKLDAAWKKPNWDILDTIIKEIDCPAGNDNIPGFYEYVDDTANIISHYNSFLNARDNRDLNRMGTELKILENTINSSEHKYHFLEAKTWVLSRKASLIPEIQERIKVLNDSTAVLWSEYIRNPVVVESLTSIGLFTTDLDPINLRLKKLVDAYQKSSEASELSKSIDLSGPHTRMINLLQKQITDICEALFTTVYLESNKCPDKGQVVKIYELITAMPSYPSNKYPLEAQIQLEKLKNDLEL